MKKSLIAVLVAVVLIGVVGTASVVLAQSPDPGTWTPGQGFGNRSQLQSEDGTGIYHEEILTIFSEALNIPLADLQARIDAGESLMQIALAEGLSFDEIKALMPVGAFGMQSQKGRGMRYTNLDGGLVPGSNCDGTCLQDGENLSQSFGPNNGRGMSRGGGRN